MRELTLDGSTWNTRDDVYDSFFAAVGVPSWHGRNFDALNDSIAAGQINQIELPYSLVIRNYDLIGAGAKQIASDFVDLLNEIATRGFPVEVRTENSL